jgi:hypothetical protein
MKWQTVDLPNGMNYHCWGPVSLRHNDLFTYEHSKINEIIALMQQGNELQYKIYGDSAYFPDTHLRVRHDYDNLTDREKLENKTLSSCREIIEWDYGNLGKMWGYLDFKKGLQMRKQHISRFYLVGMILRNAHVTMNGCQTSLFFDCEPPSFQNWTSNGRRNLNINRY